MKSFALALLAPALIAFLNPGTAMAAPKTNCKLAFGTLTDSFGREIPINGVPPEVTDALTQKDYKLTPFGADLVLALVAKTQGRGVRQTTTVTASVIYVKTGEVVGQGESTSPGMAIDANGAVFNLPSCPQ